MIARSVNSYIATASAVTGLVLTLALLFLIEALSAIHVVDDDLDQAITIDLATWQAPTAPPAAPPAKTLPLPLRKKLPDNINQSLAEKTISDPLAQPATEQAMTPVTDAQTSESDMPVPVPLFKLTETPRFLHQQQPVYPEAMRALGKTGEVVLSVLLDKTGKVRDIKVLSADDDAFTQAAIAAVLASSFIPAKIDGNPVAVKLKLPITFKLF